MSNAIIRTLCWHKWERWSEPFQGTWVHSNTFGDVEAEVTTVKYMTQRRTCEKCGKLVYRKCT